MNSNLSNQDNQSSQNQRLNVENKKRTRLTLSFMILSLISLSIFIKDKYTSISSNIDLSINLWAIFYKYQLYRFISHYFIHFGIFHLIIDLFFLYRTTILLEKQIGTLMALSFISQAMIYISIIFTMLVLLLKYITRIIHYYLDFDFLYEGGFSPLIFSMFTYCLLFKRLKNKKFSIYYLIQVKANTIPFIILLLLSFITPNQAFFGNLSGILTAYFIKYFLEKSTMLKIKWIKDFELSFSLCKNDFIYINIINNDNIITNLMEIDDSYKENKGILEKNVDKRREMENLAQSVV